MQNEANKMILAINGGSSSLKFALFSDSDLKLSFKGSVKGIGTDSSRLVIKNAIGDKISEQMDFQEPDQAAAAIIKWLQDTGINPFAVGHRLVQGGPDHRAPGFITEELLQKLENLKMLDPDHLPDELTLIRSFQKCFPESRHIACFDTWFHRELSPLVSTYPLPKQYQRPDLIHYGFHGLSYESILQIISRDTPDYKSKKIIIAHLGSGSSMAALQDGKSFDTTMGISPAGGLIMGSRLGDIDPGVLLYLLRQEQLTPDQLDEIINKKSGLKAIAGSGDLQALLNKEQKDENAARAVALFCYSARKFLGALSAAIGGIDQLIFTGGTGENSPEIRQRICAGLDFMGILIDTDANKKETIISQPKSRVTVRVIPTDEEFIIARHTRELLNQY